MLSTLLTLALGAAPIPELALLCTEPQGPLTELRFQPVGQAALAPAQARFLALPGESVQGALLPRRRAAVAVAPLAAARDLSFASSLLLLEAGRPARVLADRVQHLARPYVSAQGRLFVARGRAGSEEFDPRRTLRVDALTLDEVDPGTGATRTVHAFLGYAVFPVGEWKGALLLHRVRPEGADLVAVHPDALGLSAVATLPFAARDLAFDAKAGALFYSAPAGEVRWQVERLDLASGARAEVHAGDSMALLPAVLPDGRLAVSSGPGKGLGSPRGEPLLRSPGQGFDRLRFFTRDGALAVGLNERPDGLGTPFAVELRSGRALTVAAPEGQRLDLLGVLEP